MLGTEAQLLNAFGNVTPAADRARENYRTSHDAHTFVDLEKGAVWHLIGELLPRVSNQRDIHCDARASGCVTNA
jgi:hypothetical protein